MMREHGTASLSLASCRLLLLPTANEDAGAAEALPTHAEIATIPITGELTVREALGPARKATKKP